MGALINEDIIERVNESTDIVDLISDYLELKQSGANFLGLCPFHDEKTPSFSVNSPKQFYHCFGCGVGGDAIDFVMRMENLSFIEAVKFLADKSGIEIREQTEAEKIRQEEREKMYLINKDSARYFYNNLQKNKKAENYFINRNLKQKTINTFGLGYALESWDSLLRYLKSKGYTEEEIFEAGLIGERKDKSGYYDKFRDRVIFPIINTRDKVIGFGGRVLGDDMPKYLNSQDTEVFNKGNNLYGLNIINKSRDRDRILLVEGYMDVISLYNEGIKYSVASLGTALTVNQGKLLKRYGREVYICYDSDEAGRKATLKALDILKSIDVEAKVIVLPEGYDPDDYIKEDGVEGFNYLLNREAKSYLDYNIYINKLKHNLNDPNEKIKFTREIARMVKKLTSPIEKEVYIDKISMDTGISREAINAEMTRKTGEGPSIPPEIMGRNVINRRPRKEIVRLEPGYIEGEKTLIKFALEDRSYFNIIVDSLDGEKFITEEINLLFDIINNEYLEDETKEHLSLDNYKSNINEVSLNILEDINNINLNLIEKKQETITKLIELIKKTELEILRDKIKNEIKEAEKIKDNEKIIELTIELIEVNKLLKN